MAERKRRETEKEEMAPGRMRRVNEEVKVEGVRQSGDGKKIKKKKKVLIS